MSYVLGFAILCVCGWYWIRGSAFMAFVVSLGAVFLMLLGADEMYCHSILARAAIGVAIACAPWGIRDIIRTDWRSGRLLPRR